MLDITKVYFTYKLVKVQRNDFSSDRNRTAHRIFRGTISK